MLLILLNATNGNLLLGYLPESLGLFIFGVVLIALAIGLRWVFNRSQNAEREETTKETV